MDKPKLNGGWHLANKMPKKPTVEQRIQWHLEHWKHCGCRRDLPGSIREELAKRGMDPPGEISSS